MKALLWAAAGIVVAAAGFLWFLDELAGGLFRLGAGALGG